MPTFGPTWGRSSSSHPATSSPPIDHAIAAHGHAVAVITQPIIVIVIYLKVLIAINSILWIVSNFNVFFEFELLCEGSKCFRGIVDILFFTFSGLLSRFKLAEDTFGDKIEDMREATCLVSGAGEVLDEGRQMFDHRVIVGGVVAGDAKDLVR